MTICLWNVDVLLSNVSATNLPSSRGAYRRCQQTTYRSLVSTAMRIRKPQALLLDTNRVLCQDNTSSKNEIFDTNTEK
jgi:hypothetical protein